MNSTIIDCGSQSQSVLREVPFSHPRGPLGLPTRAQAEEAFARVGMALTDYRLELALQDVTVVTSCGQVYGYGTFYPEDRESFTLIEDAPELH